MLGQRWASDPLTRRNDVVPVVPPGGDRGFSRVCKPHGEGLPGKSAGGRMALAGRCGIRG
jgi:hypothetical protein